MKKYLKDLVRHNLFWILLIVLISVPASLPLLHEGFYHFSDEPHIANLYEMVRAISSGQIPPRMAPDINFGFGYPLFNFYYPLPYYFGSLFYFVTNSLVLSIKLVFLLTIPLSGIFMFFWLKNHTARFGALIGSIIYVYTPYRALDLYVRGALGETFAFVFFPLMGLVIDRVIKNTQYKNVGMLSIITGLLFFHTIWRH